MTSRICSKAPLLIACLILLLLSLPALARPPISGVTTRVSLTSAGVQQDADSFLSVISADGKFVAFVSNSPVLVPGDTNGVNDIFVRNIDAGTTERVSVSSAGVEANGASFNPAISSDGRYVAFASDASNLVDSDSNGATDIFVHDMVTGSTVLVSVSSSSEQGNAASVEPAISADGNVIAFASDASNLVDSDTNATTDVFVRNLSSGTTERISVSTANDEGDYDSHKPSISSDGNLVAFYSYADNLVSDDTNIAGDIFVRDIDNSSTIIASAASDGTIGNSSSINPSISPDGNFVAFESSATNLIPSDTNGVSDVFVRDLNAGTTDIVSISSTGEQGNRAAMNPSVSSDGKFIAFWSLSSNLVPDDTNDAFDIFVRDVTNGTTERDSVSTAGDQSNNGSPFPSISANGRYVTFTSYAENLVADDNNGKADVFLRDRVGAPINQSLTPNSGNITVDQQIILTSKFVDIHGADNIKSCYLLLNTSFSTDAGYLFYDAVKNKLYLRQSDSSTLIGGFAPGKSQIIDNGFIVLNCAATTVQRIGDTLTIKWSIKLKPSFAGSACNAWMRVTNKDNLVDAWKLMGTFSAIANPAPKNVSLTPNSGTITIDSPTSISSVFSDPAGFNNIKSCYMAVNTGITTSGAGYFFYDAVKNKLYLRSTGSAAMIGGFAPGSAHVIDNGSIILYCADTTINKSGNELTVNWSIALKSYFTGSPCTIMMQITNKTGQSDPWELMGIFNTGSSPS